MSVMEGLLRVPVTRGAGCHCAFVGRPDDKDISTLFFLFLKMLNTVPCAIQQDHVIYRLLSFNQPFDQPQREGLYPPKAHYLNPSQGMDHRHKHTYTHTYVHMCAHMHARTHVCHPNTFFLATNGVIYLIEILKQRRT